MIRMFSRSTADHEGIHGSDYPGGLCRYQSYQLCMLGGGRGSSNGDEERNAPSQDVPIAKPPKQWNVESGNSHSSVSPQPPGVPQSVGIGSPLESLGPSLASRSGLWKDNPNGIDRQRLDNTIHRQVNYIYG